MKSILADGSTEAIIDHAMQLSGTSACVIIEQQ